MKKYVGGELTPSPPKIVNFLGNFAQILYSTQCKRCCPQTCIFQKEACKRILLKDRKIPPKCVRVCVCLKKYLSPPPPPPWTLSIVFNYGDRVLNPEAVGCYRTTSDRMEINLSIFTTRVVNAAHLFLENINLVMRASSTHPV